MNHTFFIHFFAIAVHMQLQPETFRNFLVARFMEEMLHVPLFTFFAAAHFYLGGG